MLFVIPDLIRDPASVSFTAAETAISQDEGSGIPDQVRDDEKKKCKSRTDER
jgi:hypothetical protein